MTRRLGVFFELGRYCKTPVRCHRRTMAHATLIGLHNRKANSCPLRIITNSLTHRLPYTPHDGAIFKSREKTHASFPQICSPNQPLNINTDSTASPTCDQDDLAEKLLAVGKPCFSAFFGERRLAGVPPPEMGSSSDTMAIPGDPEDFTHMKLLPKADL